MFAQPDCLTDRLESWLLSDALQPTTNPATRGGVPGWWPADDRPRWVYLEITGYYLTTLAFIALRSPNNASRAIERMAGSLAWLDRVVRDDQLPPTRLYDDNSAGDWRNEATFSFDLGMALRGVDAARPYFQSESDRLTYCLLNHLSVLVGEDHVIESHVMHNGGSPEQLAARWSTRRGPHHVKVAGAIALVNHAEDLPWRKVTAATLSAHRLDESAHVSHLHPFAYFLEGLIQFSTVTDDPSLLTQCAAGFEAAIGSGIISSREAFERADVTAQFMRIHAVLRAAGFQVRGARDFDWASRLERFISPDGSLRFHEIESSSERSKHVNTWATMFAYQALAFDEVADSELPVEWLQLLV